MGADAATSLPSLILGGGSLMGVIVYLLRQNWLLTRRLGEAMESSNSRQVAENDRLRAENDRLRGTS